MEIFLKEVDLREPTSFLAFFILGCTQRACQVSKDIVDNYKSMLESRIFVGAMKKLPEAKAPGEPEPNTISSWSYDMAGYAKKCVERFLRTGKHGDPTISQSRDARHG